MISVGRAFSLLLGAIVNYVLKDTKIMATLKEFVEFVEAFAPELQASLEVVDVKLDELLVLMNDLKAGAEITPERLDSAIAALLVAKEKAAGVAQEATDLA